MGKKNHSYRQAILYFQLFSKGSPVIFRHSFQCLYYCRSALAKSATPLSHPLPLVLGGLLGEAGQLALYRSRLTNSENAVQDGKKATAIIAPSSSPCKAFFWSPTWLTSLRAAVNVADLVRFWTRSGSYLSAQTMPDPDPNPTSHTNQTWPGSGSYLVKCTSQFHH